VVVIAGKSTVVSSTGWEISGSANLYFEYVPISSKEANLAGLPVIHLGDISLPYRSVSALIIHRLDNGNNDNNKGTFEREVIFNGTRSRGCAFSVGAVGNYSVSFEMVLSGVVGRLRQNGSLSFGAGLRGDNFFPIADFALLPTRSPTPQFVASAGLPASAIPVSQSFGSTPRPTASSQFVSSAPLSVSGIHVSQSFRSTPRPTASSEFVPSAGLAVSAIPVSQSFRSTLPGPTSFFTRALRIFRARSLIRGGLGFMFAYYY
jgi:hypothetical protein